MADDDPGAAATGPGDADDPRLRYPRGNRLGLRHPRPTVVIVVVVVVLVAAGFAGRALRGPSEEQVFCTLAGAIAQPIAGTPDAAFDAWWDAGGATTASAVMAEALGRPVDPPRRDDFVRADDGSLSWMWRVDDAGVSVAVGPAGDGRFGVTGVDRCGYQAPT